MNIEEILHEEKVLQKESNRKITIPKERQKELRKIFNKFYTERISSLIRGHPFELTEEMPETKLRIGPMLEKIMTHGFELGRNRKKPLPGMLERRKPSRGRREYDFFESGGIDPLRFNEVIRGTYKNAIKRVFSDTAESKLPKESTIPHVNEILGRAFVQGYRQGIRERK